MPLLETKGAASAQGFGEFAASASTVYVEDVFSTYLYTGNSTSGGTQTVTNNIDLSTKGGLVWIKGRSAASDHILTDTTRGAGASATNNNALASNLTSAEDLGGSSYDYLSSFSTTGFVVKQGGTTTATRGTNYNAVTYVSWTFRKQPKFFDVVTYTGNGGTLSVSHSLASKPGCIIIKRTDSTSDWLVCTRKSDGNIYAMYLNTTAGQFYDGTEGSLWTSTAVSINWINSNVAAGFNTNGATYVMYLFAHNAGGFGLSGNDNVISCGSYSGGTGTTYVTLGYEPQFILKKNITSAGNWVICDNMRGMPTGGNSTANLFPNTTGAETVATDANGYLFPTATGFGDANANTGNTYIYIAIRRPMKVPTSGTSVFSPATVTSSNELYGTLQPSDLGLFKDRALTGDWFAVDRLRGITTGYYNPTLYTNLTNAEATPTTGDTVSSANSGGINPQNGRIYFGGSGLSTDQPLGYSFLRAPGFFDVVCYTGTGVARTVSHNLGVAPELMIVKDRTTAQNWPVYCAYLGGTNPANRYVLLNSPNSLGGTSVYWNDTAPTSSVFTVGTTASTNKSGDNFVAYLFATCPGVSKVGSYTGTGTTKQIDCGFTGGARFVLIKRTDSTGDWYVYDSARGIVAGNDPYLFLNSAAAEVTSTDYVDTYSAGFELSSTAPAGLNANGGTYIFLAIA